MIGRDVGVRRHGAGRVAARVLLILVAGVSVLSWGAASARATDYPNGPTANVLCLQIPQDLQGVVFRSYCPGQIAESWANDVQGCDGGPTDQKYVNLDGVADLTNFCKYSAAKNLGKWLLEKDHMKNGHPHPDNIRENPCDALPKENRAGCPNIKKSDYRELSTHPCMLKDPKTNKPILG